MEFYAIGTITFAYIPKEFCESFADFKSATDFVLGYALLGYQVSNVTFVSKNRVRES